MKYEYLGAAIVALIIAALLVAAQPVHATYTRYAESGTPSVVSGATCITPLDAFFGRYGQQYSGQPGDTAAVDSYTNHNDACSWAAVTTSRVAWLLVLLAALGLVAIVVIFMADALRRRPQG